MPKASVLLMALLAMTFLATPMAHAQVFTVEDNATVRADISASEVTRIAVEGERIALLRGTSGAYTTSNDINQGAVFIKPRLLIQRRAMPAQSKSYRTGQYSHCKLAKQTIAMAKPFYLFISTEQGHNYVLLLTPKSNERAALLVLKPKERETAAALAWERSEAYSHTLVRLVSAMIDQQTPKGYQITVFKKAKLFSFGADLELRLIRHYSGATLSGDVYEIKNRSKKTITLTERQFYQTGDRAIFLQQATLAPGQTTLFIKVTSHV